MAMFKKGQTVRRISVNEAGRPYAGMAVGTEAVVLEVDTLSGALSLEDWGRGHEPSRFELVRDASPQWSDVDFGDKVKVRYKKTDQEFETVAHETSDGFNGPEVLGHDLNSRLTGERFELLSIEKPKPPLPTTNGSRVIESEPEHEGLERVEAVLVGGRWLFADGRNPKWDLEPDKWSTGWTLLHDAGKDASDG